MGCQLPNYIYKNIDCDGDRISDHACSSVTNSKLWLVLSSEGCPNTWGIGNHLPADCPAAFPGTFPLYFLHGIFCKM